MQPDDIADLDDPPKRILVDFDNTLNLGEESYFTDGHEESNEEVVEWVNEQYIKGHTIIIWTARPWKAAGKTAALLDEWGVRYHGLKMNKGSGDVYVDDKAVNTRDLEGE